MPVNIFKMFLWGDYQLQNVWNITITFFSSHSKHTANFVHIKHFQFIKRASPSMTRDWECTSLLAPYMRRHTKLALLVSRRAPHNFLYFYVDVTKCLTIIPVSRIQLNRSRWNSPVKEDTLAVWPPNFARACIFLILELLDEIWAYSIAVYH